MASCSSSSSGNATASAGWSLTVATVPAALPGALGWSRIGHAWRRITTNPTVPTARTSVTVAPRRARVMLARR